LEKERNETLFSFFTFFSLQAVFERARAITCNFGSFYYFVNYISV
jgi:hypothetical protein